MKQDIIFFIFVENIKVSFVNAIAKIVLIRKRRRIFFLRSERKTGDKYWLFSQNTFILTSKYGGVKALVVRPLYIALV